MNKGHFHIKILEDGTLKITTPEAFSPETHASADAFLKALKEFAGGACVTEKLKPQHTHKHSHQHGHEHHHH